MQTTKDIRANNEKLIDVIALLENLGPNASSMVRESLETQRDLLNARNVKLSGLAG